jgi:hypothetical protein
LKINGLDAKRIKKNNLSSTPATADFKGKVFGSIVENPHIMKVNYNPTLLTPSQTWYEQDIYSRVNALDSVVRDSSSSINTYMAQHLFSFNLIRIVEDKYGPIPATDKVAWLKANISKIVCNWNGYGTCPGGNKAYIKVFTGADWYGSESHANGTVSLLTRAFTAPSSMNTYIQPDGFVHFIAYTDASNGTIASTINTDYVNLEVTMLAKELSAGDIQAGQIVEAIYDGEDFQLTSESLAWKDNIEKNKSDKTQEAWITPTLLNSWVKYSDGTTNDVEYFKDTLGFVHIKGRIVGGTSGSIAFLLPSGYRPAKSGIFPCALSGVQFGGALILSSGHVEPFFNTSMAYIDFGEIIFRAV